MTPVKLKLGTRGSPLALAQSGLFAADLKRVHPELEIELVTIKTSGDQIQDRFLATVGGKGLFTKEIEAALLKQEIDFAVHSLKDVPAKIPEALALACFPKRLDPGDVLLTNAGLSLDALPPNALIGTTSLRRRLQLARRRPDLQFAMLRGNIDTRIRRLQAGEFDAIVLAKAGMERLNLGKIPSVDLGLIPAPGQGCLAIEIRIENNMLNDLLKPLHNAETEAAVRAERHLMQALGGECNLPLGAFAEVRGSDLWLQAFIATLDGSEWIEAAITGTRSDPLQAADRLLQNMISQGAQDIVGKIQGG